SPENRHVRARVHRPRRPAEARLRRLADPDQPQGPARRRVVPARPRRPPPGRPVRRRRPAGAAPGGPHPWLGYVGRWGEPVSWYAEARFVAEVSGADAAEVRGTVAWPRVERLLAALGFEPEAAGGPAA